MSFKAMAWAAKCRTGGSTKKLILLLLADRANDDGICWPSLATIADDAELTPECVCRNVSILEKAGFLKKKKRSGAGKYKNNEYHLRVDQLINSQLIEDQVTVDPKSSDHLIEDQTNLSQKNLSKDPIKSTSPDGSSDIAAESNLGGEGETPRPPSLKEPKIPTERGYDPKVSNTFSEKSTDHECAKILATKLIEMASKAYGKKLIAKPSGSIQPIIKLFKCGVTAQEALKTLEWLYTINASSDYPFRVESGASLLKKWDSIQVQAGKHVQKASAAAEKSYVENGFIYYPNRPRVGGQIQSRKATAEQIAQHS